MMKYQSLLAIAFALAILSFSCSDDDVPGPKNSVTLNGKSFTVVSVSLLGVSIDGEGHAAVSFTATDGSAVKSLSVDFDYAPPLRLQVLTVSLCPELTACSTIGLQRIPNSQGIL